MENKYVIFLLLSVLVAGCSQILLKKSAAKSYANRMQEYLNPYVIIGYGMMVISTILVILAYRGLDYKHGPIIESISYPLVMVLSNVFFKEKITAKKVFGNFLILLGIFVYYL